MKTIEGTNNFIDNGEWLKNNEANSNYYVIETKTIPEELLDTLWDYSKWMRVKFRLWNEVYDDFVIVSFNSKNKTYTIKREISNWTVVTKASKERLDYYNKLNFIEWQEVVVKVKWKYLMGTIIEIDEKKDKYLVRWTGEEWKKESWFSWEKLSKYNDYIHIIGTDEYIIGKHTYMREGDNFVLVE